MSPGNSSTSVRPLSSFGTSRYQVRNCFTLTIPKSIATATTVVAVGLFVAGVAVSDGQLYMASAIALFTIGLYATGAAPPHVTAVCFFLFAVLAEIAPTRTILSGFASMGFWMVFGGLLIGIAVRETGLARRVARAMANRLGWSYSSNVAGIIGVSLAFAFIIPSTMGRGLVICRLCLNSLRNRALSLALKGEMGS